LEDIKAAVTGSLAIMFGYLAERLAEATARTGLYMYVLAISSVGL